MIRFGLLFALSAFATLAPGGAQATATQHSISAPSSGAFCQLRGYERRTQGGTLSQRQRERCLRAAVDSRTAR